MKLKLRARRAVVASWQLRVDLLPHGVYRLDLDMDDATIWRAYFQVFE